jgi:hypothetical protein
VFAPIFRFDVTGGGVGQNTVYSSAELGWEFTPIVEIKNGANWDVLTATQIETYFDKGIFGDEPEIDNIMGRFNFSAAAIGKVFCITERPIISDDFAYSSGFNPTLNFAQIVVTVKSGWNAYDLRDLQMLNNVPNTLESNIVKVKGVTYNNNDLTAVEIENTGDKFNREKELINGKAVDLSTNALWGEYRKFPYYNGHSIQNYVDKLKTENIDIHSMFLHNDISLYMEQHNSDNKMRSGRRPAEYEFIPLTFREEDPTKLPSMTTNYYMKNKVVLFANTTFNQPDHIGDFYFNGNYFTIDSKDVLSRFIESNGNENSLETNIVLFGVNADRAPYRQSDFMGQVNNFTFKNTAFYGGAVPNDPVNYPPARAFGSAQLSEIVNPISDERSTYLGGNGTNDGFRRVSVNYFSQLFGSSGVSKLSAEKQMKYDSVKVRYVLNFPFGVYSAGFSLHDCEITEIDGPWAGAEMQNFVGAMQYNSYIPLPSGVTAPALNKTASVTDTAVLEILSDKYIFPRDETEYAETYGGKINIDKYTVEHSLNNEITQNGAWFSSMNAATTGMASGLIIMLESVQDEFNTLFSGIDNAGTISVVKPELNNDRAFQFVFLYRQQKKPVDIKHLISGNTFRFDSYEIAELGDAGNLLNSADASNSAVKFFNEQTAIVSSDPDTNSNGFGQFSLFVGKNGAFAFVGPDGKIFEMDGVKLIGKMWADMPTAEQDAFRDILLSGNADAFLSVMSGQGWLATWSTANSVTIATILNGNGQTDLAGLFTLLDTMDGATLTAAINANAPFISLPVDISGISDLNDPILLGVKEGIREYARNLVREGIIDGMVLPNFTSAFIPYDIYSAVVPNAKQTFYDELTNYTEWQDSHGEWHADRFINWFIKMPGDNLTDSYYNIINASLRLYGVEYAG